MHGTLYIVATPIGNLEDITLRGIETLKNIDLIACEDTRHTQILLARYDIHKPLLSYFEHNKQTRSKQIIALLEEGKNVALVSDAGTPGISDPGFRVVKEAIAQNISVVPIPGASAVITALSASGAPTDRFIFEGFLPNRSAARRKRMLELKHDKRTIVFYESPHRLVASLNDIKDVLGPVDVVVAREITKKFEEIKRGSADELINYFEQKKARGEFVIIINQNKKQAKI